MRQSGLEAVIKSFKAPEDIEHWFDAPLELIGNAKDNPPTFLRDKASRVTGAISPYIRRLEYVEKAIDEDLPNIFDEVLGKFVDGTTCPNPNHLRFMHVDLAQNRDAVGVCAVHVPHFVAVEVFNTREKRKETVHMPSFVVDFAARIEPRKGEDIELSDIEFIIYDFKDLGFPVGLVTYDGFQSLHSIQNLEKRGIISAHLSIDRTTSRVVLNYDKDKGYDLVSVRGDHMAAYSALRTSLYGERFKMPYHPMWIQEIKEQEEEKGRVRKILNGRDDLVQAIAGAVFNAESNVVHFEGVKAPAQDLKNDLDREFAERMERDIMGREEGMNRDQRPNEDGFYRDLKRRY